MKRNNKYYKAILLSTKLWTWLYQNPNKAKEDSPYWGEIRNVIGNCPLCDYYQNQVSCGECILFKRRACRNIYTARLDNSRYVAYYYAFKKNAYKTKCARAFIAAKLRRELRRLQMKEERRDLNSLD